MPVRVSGRKIIEKRTGKVKAVAKTAKKARISASVRNRAYKTRKR
jgi:hypothetical protein